MGHLSNRQAAELSTCRERSWAAGGAVKLLDPADPSVRDSYCYRSLGANMGL